MRVLEGMAKGFKDGDPNIVVAPGAFQADTPDVPPQGDGISWTNKYAGSSLSLSLCLSLSFLSGAVRKYSSTSRPIFGLESRALNYRPQICLHKDV